MYGKMITIYKQTVWSPAYTIIIYVNKVYQCQLM